MVERTTRRLQERTAFERPDRQTNARTTVGGEQTARTPSVGDADGRTKGATTGTTTVAVTAGDAVVVAADQRASLGGRFVANKAVRKLEAVHDTAALALSGSVGAVQDLAATLEAEAGLYEVRRGEPLSMTSLASVAGHLVRGVPAQLLLGGVDETGAHVFELDGGGSVMPSPYAAAGSGMQVAYGVLDGAAETVADPAAGRALALDAVAAATERDTASGNGAHVATITTDGVDVEDVRADDLAAKHSRDRTPSGGDAA